MTNNNTDKKLILFFKQHPIEPKKNKFNERVAQLLPQQAASFEIPYNTITIVLSAVLFYALNGIEVLKLIGFNALIDLYASITTSDTALTNVICILIAITCFLAFTCIKLYKEIYKQIVP